MPIIGGKDCPSVTDTPAHGAVFYLCQNLKVTALHTPCHTEDSICFFVEDGEERAVFSGDTLFHGGMLRYLLLRRANDKAVADSSKVRRRRWTGR